MGRNILQKALHGAAKSGAEYIKETSLMEKMSSIQAARDNTLNEYRKANQASQNEFTVDQAVSSQEFTAGENILNREAAKTARENSPQTILAQGKVNAQEKVTTLMNQLGEAKTAEEKEAIFDAIDAANGTVGSKFIGAGSNVFNKATGQYVQKPASSKDNRKWVAEISRDLYEGQKNSAGRMPEGAMTYEAMLKKMEPILLAEEDKPASVVTENPTGAYKSSADVRSAMNSGTITRSEALSILRKDFGMN
jgi:hypothetical protein